MLIKNIKTSAWVLTKQNKPLKKFDLYIPKLKKGQFLVKILYTGFCSSQYGEIIGIKGKDKYLPHCLGHEAVGKVLKKNSKKKISVGSYVVMHWMKSLGSDSKKINYFTENNKIVNSGMITTFSDYAIISENRLTKINSKKNDLKYYSLLGCSIPVGISTVEKVIKANKNEKILLIGSGAIGLPIVHYCKNKKIYIDVIDKRKKSLQKSIFFGCSKTYQKINTKELINKLKSSYYDHVIDTSGNSKLLNKILKIIKPKVNICLLGVAKKESKIELNQMKINYGIKVIGSYGGDFNPDLDINKYFTFLKKTNFNFDKYLDKIYPINNINNLIDDFKSKKIIGKAILKT